MGKKLSKDEITTVINIESTKAQQEIQKLLDVNKELSKSNKERLKSMLSLEQEGQKHSQQYRNLQETYKKTTSGQT